VKGEILLAIRGSSRPLAVFSANRCGNCKDFRFHENNLRGALKHYVFFSLFFAGIITFRRFFSMRK
jgi:hypothetical protein